MPEFLFYVPFDTPFKFIVSSFFLLFQMHHGGVLLRTIIGESCYMAHAIRLVVDLARRHWTDCSLQFNTVDFADH